MSGENGGEREATIAKFHRDRVLAHQVLFRHRHPDDTPPFHREMIQDFHSPDPYILWLAYRGSAKSTISEEGVALRACFQEFGNCLIIGASADRAGERLHAIKREFEQNEALFELFTNLRGAVWTDTMIELSNGRVIQSLGRGQSLRGIKHLDKRPDLLIVDDLEDREAVRTLEGRQKVNIWFMTELLPALDPNHKVRMAATPLPEALSVSLARSGTGFKVRRYPVEYLDVKGERRSIWPSREPLNKIDSRKARYVATGTMQEYRQEYEVNAEAAEDRPFKREMFRTEPLVRTWQSVYCMFDPARSVNPNSAQTGFAAWSWISNRLHVWEARGQALLPDQIVNWMFEENERYQPVWLGVEKDGLEQFLLQPLRHEMIKRGIILPLRAELAPKSKSKQDFIKGLQPFFASREVIFDRHFTELENQLMAFTTGSSGLVDVLNALAYATKLRPGVPVYEDFTTRHIVEDSWVTGPEPAYLVLSASASLLCGSLIQVRDGILRVYANWTMEGEPAANVSPMIQGATLEASRPLRILATPQQFDKYANNGVVQAATRTNLEVRRGTTPEEGRSHIRKLLRQEFRGMPAVLVDARARRILNGLAGGFARAVKPGGQIEDYPEEGFYRTLIEGIESFAGLLGSGFMADEADGDDNRNWQFTRDGKRFISAMPNRSRG